MKSRSTSQVRQSKKHTRIFVSKLFIIPVNRLFHCTADNFTDGAILPLRQALETRLGEVVVRGENFIEILGFHDRKACAIGERVCFVTEFEELGSCRFQNISGKILDPHAGAGRDGLPPGFCRWQSEAHAQQGQRLINHIVSEQDGSAGLKPFVPCSQCILVNRIVFVRASHPAGRVGEQNFHEP